MADINDLLDESRNYLEDVQEGVERLKSINAQAEGLGMMQIQKKAELAEKAVGDSIGVIEGIADALAAIVQGLAEVANNGG
jgi:hypothetical protein